MYEGVRSVRAAGYNTWTCTSDFYRTKLWSRKIRPDQTGVRAGVVLSVLVNLPFAALEIFCPKILASLMLNDATVISYTCIFLPVTGVVLFALGWLFVFRNACQGMGKTVLPMVSGIVEVAMRVMVVLLLAPRLAFRGVAFAEISAWVGAGVMLMITYFFIRGGSPGKLQM